MLRAVSQIQSRATIAACSSSASLSSTTRARASSQSWQGGGGRPSGDDADPFLLRTTTTTPRFQTIHALHLQKRHSSTTSSGFLKTAKSPSAASNTPHAKQKQKQTAMASEHAVLARLLSSNAQWARDVQLAEPSFFEEGAKGQYPKVLWFGCSDSRVPESVVLACRPGEVFVHRNIANQFHPHDDSATSVLTYAIENVGVEHVVVVGHTQCGGAAACFAAACAPPSPTPPASTPLNRWLGPLINLTTSLKLAASPPADALRRIVEENVKVQVQNVIASDVIQGAWKEGKKVWVHGWLYELETGTLKDLGVSASPP